MEVTPRLWTDDPSPAALARTGSEWAGWTICGACGTARDPRFTTSGCQLCWLDQAAPTYIYDTTSSSWQCDTIPSAASESMTPAQGIVCTFDDGDDTTGG